MSKKFLIVLCLVLLSTGLFAQMLGDVNGDKSIDIVDALQVVYYVVSTPIQPFYPQAADVIGCDGSINLVDALVIAQYSVGIIDRFPCDTEKPLYIEFSISGGIAGYTYKYTVNAAEKLATYTPPNVKPITITLTDEQIKWMQTQVELLNKVAVPNDTQPCCCDRYAYNLLATVNTINIESKWSDCTENLPAELNVLIMFIKSLYLET